MKRVGFLITLVALLSLVLAACGTEPTAGEDPGAAPAEEEVEEAAAPAEEEAEPAEEEMTAEEEAEPAEEEMAAEEEAEPAEEEMAAEEEAEASGGLAAVCPNPVVIQTDWFPEAEHGAMYQMVGDDYIIDTDNKVVRGSLMASGEDTGVEIEVRTGGPAIGFQNPNTQMYVETDILLGYVSTDEAVLGAEDTPTLAVVAPLEKNPQIIMWDPETYPDVESIADLKETGATVNVFAGGTFIDVFVSEGVLNAEQIDPSYDGSPARFIAENGAIAQQGFASAEPFVYLNEIEEWGKPVEFQLIHDAGLEIYSQALAIRAGELEEHRPCLEQLVPIVQQSVVDYVESPDRANAIIVDAVEQFEDFWVYPPELAEYSVDTQLELGLVGNGPDGVVGNMEPERIQSVIDKMRDAGMDLVEGLEASDVTTNEFIDESIGLPEMAMEEASAEEEPAAEEEMAAEAMVPIEEVCPNPVVIQTDWFPEAEYGATYQLIGDDYIVDTQNKFVRGSLMASGEDTGIDVEVRTGGPAIGFQQPIQQMYVETDIFLGYVSTNEAVFGAEDTPTLSVVAPLEKNPQIIMWDPETYPDVETIADLKETGATVNVFAGGTFIDVFVSEGVISADQVDPSYDGSPARWVAEGGAIAQQGFASAEPFVYENEIEEWGQPVAFQLIHDAGFEIYSQALAIRKGELDQHRPCLEQLVPIIQQSVVDYVTNPEQTNALIVDVVEQYQDFWVYSPELAEFSVNTQLELGLVGNGPDDTVGNLNPERVQGVIDQMAAASSDVPEDLEASDIISNEFIDENIGLPE